MSVWVRVRVRVGLGTRQKSSVQRGGYSMLAHMMSEWCVCLLLLLVGIGCAEVSRLTADELLSSESWKDLSRTFLILAEGNYGVMGGYIK